MTRNTGYSGRSPSSNEAIVNKFLSEAECRYGPRFPGVTFEVNEIPSGPLDTLFDSSRMHAIIRIPAGQSPYDQQGQLAHESIHVFSPATPAEATYFDEGLATYFAIQVRSYHPFASGADAKYVAAADAVARLDEYCPDAIKRIRSSGKRIATITKEEIMLACPKLSENDAALLVSRFNQQSSETVGPEMRNGSDGSNAKEG